jgi:UDPglucose 6-dehydrogenase
LKVAVIGTGYVGLVVGAGLAETGNSVTCVDINEERIRLLKEGVIPIFEPGLESMVRRNFESGRLKFTTDTVKAVSENLVIFLAVPTPMGEDGSADLKHVLDAAAEVASGINEFKVIVDKSTVPVGTAAKVQKLIAGLTDKPFAVVSNPEFLKEGNAVGDFLKPDRVVIGCDNAEAETIISELYAPFVRTGHPILTMSPQSAELTKYAANALLATKISFINELAVLCDQLGADVNEVRQGIGTDSRIGPNFLFPGMGFGGSCFPKDLRALNYTAQQNGVELRVVKAAIDANEVQKNYIPQKISKHFSGNMNGLTIAVWGLAFKANTDDIRESPAMPLLDFLLENGVTINAYDPQAMDATKKIYKDQLNFHSSVYDAVDNADALVIATEWNEFRHPDFEKILRSMKQPIVFDGRNLFSTKAMEKLGFVYYSVGQQI